MHVDAFKWWFFWGLGMILLLTPACDIGDESIPQPSIEMPVAAPRLFVTRTEGDLTLTWGWFNAGAQTPQSFKVYQGQSPISTDFALQATLAGDLTSWQPQDIQPGKVYYFQLEVEGENNQTVRSNTVMVTLGTSFGRKLLASSPQMDYSHGRWSPDGQWLAFNATAEGNIPHILLAQSGRSERIEIEGSDPHWFPGDLRMIYRGLEKRVEDQTIVSLAVASPLSGFASAFTIGGDADYRYPVVSADGKQVAFISDRQDGEAYALYTYELAKENSFYHWIDFVPDPTWPYTAFEQAPQHLQWHPWEPLLVYDQLASHPSTSSASPPINRDIYFFDFEKNEVIPIESSIWDDHSPVFSPAGNTIAFISDRSGLYEIWVKNLFNQELRMITGNGIDFPLMAISGGLEWKKNGSEIIYTGVDENGRKGIYTLSLQ
ncbi:MAG: hypothetical protein AAF135_06455 [Bacteroidota bacterium]